MSLGKKILLFSVAAVFGVGVALLFKALNPNAPSGFTSGFMFGSPLGFCLTAWLIWKPVLDKKKTNSTPEVDI